MFVQSSAEAVWMYAWKVKVWREKFELVWWPTVLKWRRSAASLQLVLEVFVLAESRQARVDEASEPPADHVDVRTQSSVNGVAAVEAYMGAVLACTAVVDTEDAIAVDNKARVGGYDIEGVDIERRDCAPANVSEADMDNDIRLASAQSRVVAYEGQASYRLGLYGGAGRHRPTAAVG
ncbi:hypothetical protein LTS18_011548 [Coniosporium uncinatum]|uniref:Uncharacterized protein n=1 Tax=Coniosporium uncinatum TaxID=93489 RepID=A0ACC3DKD3_9PEZI|nr:hypothetical protein LTS18_011548 [Coniosporium uncinatum]